MISSNTRIIQIHSYDQGGGAEATVRLHHEELHRQGYQNHLFVAHKKGSDQDTTQIPYVRGIIGTRRFARLLEKATGRQYIYSPSFRALLKQLPTSADIVHIHALHGAQGYADMSLLKWLSKKVPVILTVNDLWLLTGHCAYPLMCKRWLQGCGQCPDLKRYPAIPRDGTKANWNYKQKVFAQANIQLIAPSQWVIEQIKQSPILGHLPVHLVYNPLDTSIFFPTDRQLVRQALNLPQDKKIILMVAQSLTNFYKGVPEGLAAINQLVDSGLYIVMIGRDAEQALQKCNIPGRAIAYQANQADLVDFYRAADIFLMPSRCETFGMVAAEAMACGTPVVAFAAGGLTDVLGDNEGGILVENGNVGGVVSALEMLLKDDEQRRILGAVASQRSHREFNLQSHTRRCLEVYENCMN